MAEIAIRFDVGVTETKTVKIYTHKLFEKRQKQSS